MQHCIVEEDPALTLGWETSGPESYLFIGHTSANSCNLTSLSTTVSFTFIMIFVFIISIHCELDFKWTCKSLYFT